MILINNQVTWLRITLILSNYLHMFLPIWGTTIQQLFIFYLVQLMTLIYLLTKYKKSKFYILVILLFYPAIFSFLGKDFLNYYRVITLILTLWIVQEKNALSKFKKGDVLITTLFVVFSLTFFYSTLLNNDSFTIILSQYSRFLIAYLLWFIIRKELFKNECNNIEKFKKFTYTLVLFQILISVAKLLIFEGRQIESLVGSVSHIGGAEGTTIPIVGFITLWFYRRGELKINDWVFTFGLMLIGFLAGKRAVWFMLPITIALFMIYIPKIKLNKTLLVTLLLAPFAFYLGVRLTPTLNPERKVWGSFNYEYAFDYANTYQFGDDSNRKKEVSQGRGGATLSLFNKITDEATFTSSDWFGIGLTKMYTTSYDEFNKLGVGLSMKGDATGVFQNYVSSGFMGIITTVLFFFSFIWRIKINRIRWVILLIISWEYFMYTGTIFRNPCYMFLIIYFIHYSNFLVQKRPKTIQFSDYSPVQKPIV